MTKPPRVKTAKNPMARNNTPLPEIAQILRAHERFVVMSHVRPDGDALGCIIAMALCLQAARQGGDAWNEDGMLEKFRFLPGSELVSQPPAEPRDFDVAIVLDTAVQNRAGDRDGGCEIRADSGSTSITTSATKATAIWCISTPLAPATGQISYELFRARRTAA